jgi:UMF1 family MFS transporter
MLRAGVRRREVLGWAFFDFANSGYTTVVITAVFNAYFVGVIAAGKPWATFGWTAALAVASLIAAALAPVLGAWADRRGARKSVLLGSTIGCVAATGLLAFTGPDTLVMAICLVVLSNVCFGIGEALIASFLPDLAEPHALGKVSGWGWGLGYFGGMLTLGLSLAWLLSAPDRGLTVTQAVPDTMLITAIVFAVASIPTFLLLRERKAVDSSLRADDSGVSILSRLAVSLAELRNFPDLRQLLACTVLYQSGIAVVIALAAVYATQQMGFSQTDTMALIFAVNIASAAGAFAFGPFQDRVGHRRALAITLVGWLAMTLLAGIGESRSSFWVAAALAGLCMGASQSCARAMVGLLAPPDRSAEFFGLWSLAVRIASIIGPLGYGAVTWVTDGQHRVALLSTGLFFVLALVWLRGLDIDRGRQLALGGGCAPVKKH